MLGSARKGQSFQIHFTNENMVNSKSGNDVGKLVKKSLKNHDIDKNAIFRKDKDLGVRVDLLDEMPF